jgi:hypothetical protein
VEIPWTKQIQYLGLHFTSTLNFNTHIKRSAHKALGHLIQLFHLLDRESSLAPATKLHLYKTSIRPTMTYAAPVRCSISPSTYQYLQVIQNKCLRVITQSPIRTPISHLHTVTGIDYLHTYIRSLAERFYAQCPEHENPLVRSIGNYTRQDLLQLYKKYRHKRPKHILL